MMAQPRRPDGALDEADILLIAVDVGLLEIIRGIAFIGRHKAHHHVDAGGAKSPEACGYQRLCTRPRPR